MASRICSKHWVYTTLTRATAVLSVAAPCWPKHKLKYYTEQHKLKKEV
jgi:hypothetical protein